MLRQVFEAVRHLHEKNLMHGDLKMLNIVRFRIDNRLRLIDLDASAKIVPIGGEDDNNNILIYTVKVRSVHTLRCFHCPAN
jgi:serine/threonine protein kinase